MSRDWQNIPHEMREFRQWLLWRAEETADGKPTKVPYQTTYPTHLADITNPNHWSDFDTTCKVAEAQHCGIGFIFTDQCPYSGIDLDYSTDPKIIEKQKTIYETFQTYSEFSPSGQGGMHLIVRGKVPRGRRFRKIEIYPHSRFFTMTGTYVQMLRGIPDRQDMLTQLYNEMGQVINSLPALHQGDAPQTQDDQTIFNMAMGAENGVKFASLWNGDWTHTIDERIKAPYPSPSEADLALMNMLAFYTQNEEQLIRLFHTSGLGKRHKAQRKDYLGWLITKSFDQMPPLADIDYHLDNLKDQVTASIKEELLATPKPPRGVSTVSDNPYTVPPGLVGRIAQFCYNASPRPVPEIALAAAITLVAGIAGRAYNINNTGLNQYIILVAPTGVGKEAMSSSVDRLLAACATKPYAPAIMVFRGPAEIASGQALLKFLENEPSIFTVMGEFGYKLQQLSSDRASSADLMLKRVLLDLYGKSGAGQIVQPMIYSDSMKNTKPIYNPAFSLLCEGTPKTIYENITERIIEDGLLPRCTIIEYLGKRVPTNKTAAYAVPTHELLTELTQLVTISSIANNGQQAFGVGLEPEAQRFLDEFDTFADAKVNETEVGVTRQLWTRVYVKALKLAATIAVGCDPRKPMITLAVAKWAHGIIMHEVTAFLRRFEEGEVGSAANVFGRNEIAQAKLIAGIVLKYLSCDYRQVVGYNVDKKYHDDKIIPHSYIMRSCHRNSIFIQAKDDAKSMIKKTEETLVDLGVLIQVNIRDASFISKFGNVRPTTALYMVADYDELVKIAGRKK